MDRSARCLTPSERTQNTTDSGDRPRYRQIHLSTDQRYGPGENGNGVSLEAKDIRDPVLRRRYEAEDKRNAYNTLAADVISLHRSLPGNLHSQECVDARYPQDLPDASVVVPFRNERLRTLLRTVHSVLDRSPPDLLREVILVDDGSTEGWLEPLLWRLSQAPRSLVFPSMDVISADALQYFTSGRQTVLPGWTSRLEQSLESIKKDYLASLPSPTSPVRSPAFQGWAFAMWRHHFLDLGGFDPGLELWGSEQYELSFKVWMCGGTVEFVPCSRAGHLYRSRVIWGQEFQNAKYGGPHRYNAYRVADVWMDEYGALVMEANGNHSFPFGFGNTTEQKLLRQTNKCGTFQGYLNQLRNITDMYLPENLQAWGTITHVVTELCVYADLHPGPAGVRRCSFKGDAEFWEWSQHREVRHDRMCLGIKADLSVLVTECDYSKRVTWTYNEDSQLRHDQSGKCLKVGANDILLVGDCRDDPHIRWYWRRKRS